MRHIASLFACTSWAAFHAAGAGLVLVGASPAIPHATAIAVVQVLLSGLFALGALRVLNEGPDARCRLIVLAALAGSIAVATAQHLSGAGDGAPGEFAAAVAMTLLALAFDRMIWADDEETSPAAPRGGSTLQNLDDHSGVRR